MSRGYMSGIQVGIWNQAGSVEGLQLGLVNIAEKMYGLQIGLWTRSTRSRAGITFCRW